MGAQTKGQFHLIYGTDGTQALFTGLATQIVLAAVIITPLTFMAKPPAQPLLTPILIRRKPTSASAKPFARGILS